MILWIFVSYNIDLHKIHILTPAQWEHYRPTSHQLQVVVIVDVFRACTTAAYLLSLRPKIYILATSSAALTQWHTCLYNPVLVGKPEQGVHLRYHIPNSPTRVKALSIVDKPILHRSAAGAMGILLAKRADIVLAASFVNAAATAAYIKNLSNAKVIIIPMGHEGVHASLEDDLCAQYIKALIQRKKLNLAKFMPALQKGPGKYFFSEDQWQYPEADFFRCLEIDRFNFIIRATVMDNYALLTRWD